MKDFTKRAIAIILIDTQLNLREEAIADFEKMKQLNNCSNREVLPFLYIRFGEV